MNKKINIVIDQGAHYSQTFNLLDADGVPIDVTDCVANGAMRKHYTSSNAVNFTTALDAGVLSLSLTAAQTANVTAGRYVYDVKFTDSVDTVTRILEGIATVTPKVS